MPRETNKKIHNTRPSQDQAKAASSTGKPFPANLLGGSSSFPLTGTVFVFIHVFFISI